MREPTGESWVGDALDGVVAAAGQGALARLDHPGTHAVIRRRHDPTRVAVISGGGAGHEPAHVGFVGGGMLAGAVSGEVFATPSVGAILACIRAVTGPAGCLIVVKNYVRDLFSFGQAAEAAKRAGLRVEVVVVADDIDMPDVPQPRGVAGTLFVHKVAGHLAERGESLETVARAARATAEASVSLGVVLADGPGSLRRRTDRRAVSEEPGREPGPSDQSEPPEDRTLVRRMLDRLAEVLTRKEVRYGLLVNDLGSVPCIETSLVVHEILRSRLAPRVELLFGPARFLTSLDTNGISLSLVELDDARREALMAPVEPAAWRPGVVLEPAARVPAPEGRTTPYHQPSMDPAAREVLRAVGDAWIDLAGVLDGYDAKVGDGDTGSTLATVARSVRARLGELPLAEPGNLCAAIAEIDHGARGSSAALLSIFLTAGATALDGGGAWPAALAAGTEAVQRYGGAKSGDRTLLDALLPAVDAFVGGRGPREAARAARVGAEGTAKMAKASVGRSSHLGARELLGVPDPGAVAVAAAFEAYAECHERQASRPDARVCAGSDADTKWITALVLAVAEAVRERADELTELDQAIGDGDHGVNMRRGFDAVVQLRDDLESLALGEVLQKCGMTLVMKVGGASGPLFGSLLMGMGKTFGEGLAPAQVAAAMRAGVESVEQRGKSQQGDKTLLDVLSPVLEAIEAAGADPWSADLVENVRKAARQGLEATRGLQARRGRASFLRERSIGHLDPGARSVQLIVETICVTLRNGC